MWCSVLVQKDKPWISDLYLKKEPSVSAAAAEVSTYGLRKFEVG
jgi:hypothetical protein